MIIYENQDEFWKYCYLQLMIAQRMIKDYEDMCFPKIDCLINWEELSKRGKHANLNEIELAMPSGN